MDQGICYPGRTYISGTISASAIVVTDVDEALAELVEEGMVEIRDRY